MSLMSRNSWNLYFPGIAEGLLNVSGRLNDNRNLHRSTLFTHPRTPLHGYIWCHNTSQLLVSNLLSALCFPFHLSNSVNTNPATPSCPAVTIFPPLPLPDLQCLLFHLLPIYLIIQSSTYISPSPLIPCQIV